MQQSNAPSKIKLPFANSGTKNTIPVPSQIGITPGLASYTDGFPPLTFTPVASGGVPPYGADFNGVLNAITAINRWNNAGAGYAYDSAFATDSNVGGYPKGARILRADGNGYWLNQTDNNTTDPDAGGAGWVPDYVYGAASIVMTSSNYTLSVVEAARPVIQITGTLTTNLNLIFPTYVKNWTVLNQTTGAFTITAKTAAGSGVIVTQGISTPIVGDGTNIYNTSSASLSISTTGQAQGLTDNTSVLSPLRLAEAFKGANQVLASSGRQLLPGGLLRQWGVVTGVTTNATISVTFPVAFPTQYVTFGMFDITGSSDGGAQQNNPRLTGAKSNTGFTAVYSRSNTGDFLWWAEGY